MLEEPTAYATKTTFQDLFQWFKTCTEYIYNIVNFDIQICTADEEVFENYEGSSFKACILFYNTNKNTEY